MKSILDEIIDNKRIEISHLKSNLSYRDFEKSTFFNRECISLKDKFKEDNFGIIAEIKRKSPSAGILKVDLNITDLGIEYERNGAFGISCLTDQNYFGGSIQDLIELRNATQLPILRKEFIIDEIQIFESKAIGADAILLISEILTKEQALHLTIIAQSLGMEVLMEFHEANQLNKINDLVDLVGVNNRNLKLQTTSINNSLDLFNFLPSDKPCISESGIKTKEELSILKSIGYNGALIGESVLKNVRPGDFLESMSFAS